MGEADANQLRFNPRARLIRTIGDQLISGPEAAVIELVKNSYDADASYVVIKFHPPLRQGAGAISIVDDGNGMTLSDIAEKWMEPATASKVNPRLSPKKSRVMMGSKGIGRFAAAKLGQRMSLLAVSDRDGQRKEVLIPEIDWAVFDGETYLSDVAIAFMEQTTNLPTGTTIEISSLSENWNEAKVSRLYLELRRLVPPAMDGVTGPDFRIFLDLSLCTSDTCGFDGRSVIADSGDQDFETPLPSLSGFEVRPFPLLTSSDYELRGEVSSDGTFTGTFLNRRAGQGEVSVLETFPPDAEEVSCGPFAVKLFIFDREADVIKETMRRAGMGNLTATQARAILNEVTGVAIYRSGFRVRPYGDAANDWLTLDRRRVQEPSLRIGHNQVAGFISVADQETSNLIERSSREGFEDNEAFERLKGITLKLLSRIVEPKRYEFRARTGLSRPRQTDVGDIAEVVRLDRIRKVLPSLAEKDRQQVQNAVDAEAAALSGRLEAIDHRQRALESVATLGGIVRVVIHEGTPEVTYLGEAADTLQEMFPDLLQPGPRCETAKEEFPSELEAMASSSERLRLLFEALTPLAGGRRITPQMFNPVNVIREVRRLFRGAVPIEIHNPEMISEVFGYSADLSTALSNLVNNSVFWLRERRIEHPKIDIRITSTSADVIISVEDNAGGIPAEFGNSIFNVGFTLKEGGTGLGLSIAKETLARSGATIQLDTEFSGGARFEIRFARRES